MLRDWTISDATWLSWGALPEILKEDPAKSSFERAEEALLRWPDLSLRKLAQRANTHYSTVSRVRKRMRQEGSLA